MKKVLKATIIMKDTINDEKLLPSCIGLYGKGVIFSLIIKCYKVKTEEILLEIFRQIEFYLKVLLLFQKD